jgi:hypothetical protein
MVFSRIRNKIHFLAAHMSEEGQDIVDLRLVTYCVIDRNRLMQVLQGKSLSYEFPPPSHHAHRALFASC